MMKRLIILAALVVMCAGCAKDRGKVATREGNHAVSEVGRPTGPFRLEVLEGHFDQLLLADDPLHCEDCHALLSWVDYEDRNRALTKEEISSVCTKLRAYLGRTTPQKIDTEGGLTGVARVEGVLRAYSVQPLGRFGGPEEVTFLAQLQDYYVASHRSEFEYPGLPDACAKAVKAIEGRLGSNRQEATRHPRPRRREARKRRIRWYGRKRHALLPPEARSGKGLSQAIPTDVTGYLTRSTDLEYTVK
jgi:hypothetical protein